jgi:hypothetical protein
MNDMITQVNKSSVEDLTTAILARAKRLFPKLVIHGTLASRDGLLVYRVNHELAIRGSEPWIAIIKLTRLRNSDGRVAMTIEDMKHVVEEYDVVVDQALDLKLFSLESFRLAE